MWNTGFYSTASFASLLHETILYFSLLTGKTHEKRKKNIYAQYFI